MRSARRLQQSSRVLKHGDDLVAALEEMTHANVAPVAFRAASGDDLGNYTPKVAVFAHPTDAAGTKGDFEGETTSIVASFDFHPLKTRELSQIPAR